MQDFSSFISTTLDSVCDFLTSEPICWFVALIILFNVIALTRYIMFGERR